MDKTAERAATTPTRYLDVDGVRYAYRELGPDNPVDKTPILFLHRFRGTLDDWDPGFVDALAKTRHVILFSDQEVGSSSGSAATSVDEKARNAADFAKKLGFLTIDVLGFSMGGFVAQAIAINEPTLVRKVIIVGAAGGGNPEAAPPTDIVFEIALRPEYSLEDVQYLFFAQGRDEETRAYLDRRATRTSNQEPPVTPEVIGKMVSLIGDFMSGKTGHYEKLKDLRQPTLIVSGDRDPFFPFKNIWMLYRELPNAQLLAYPNSGHGPHQQHPEEVAEKIEYFLSTK
ncbi:alpha/beta hydrolase [Paraburkholderia sp. BL10I2N1]|uniref:alpha/beta fold hydrolase n=1 Tax=Paraburkholderia sp. BL10I2N1 TaxID=1938796 RepID=UPI00105C3379|nr:alpha/beta hydrolase [Paraburkholderia sp. BL10I2N1]TDN69938.1 pimeloyl-ACP methyl ester carboxylesterase [Paraburkholderia sp. BL10I2N1]